MAVVCRPACSDDLARADELVVASINELTERRGFGKMASSRPQHFQAFSLADDPEGLWVAEDDGDIVGFAWSWVCGELWFLAQLFVAPDRQSDGIGNQLLGKSFAHAVTRGASVKALITFAFNNVSQGLYIRHGLFPRCLIYMVSVPRERLASRLAEPPLRLEPLAAATARFEDLVPIDVSALGVSRAKHHRYLLGDSTTNGFTIHAGRESIGYVYISDGHIGPLAVRRPDLVGPAFAAALSLAARSDVATISAFLPGSSEPALKVATDYGMHLTFPMLLMSNRQFGDWVSYLPRNPGFM
ncbi:MULTISPECIES: GNAT family N-acetyltransferase [unclassified Bradyrhizobium]|uniref:GNAT family N-acetyltransferase n=1 Tax=unclassified Bradyrhizobium TaxID=2631580 RepID=UPI0015C9AC04|nr:MULTISPECIES: GNAT family N-acetyltransferase [unclassified Bradyrhizobium]MBB4259771.1 GNAT superfamily N-acetyltransferase [Bradyrhizobium sp. CIR3A]NYG49433.1 GNAT superfamily N-acetyltransferase [Bradyrhizobium sp. IAR9]